MLIVFHPFLRGIDSFMQHYHSISILSTHLSHADYEIVKQEYPIALSIFHTSFNILNTLMLIGFAKLIAKIATKMVPDDDEEEEEFRLQYINSGLFSTSELSIMQAKNEISNFGSRIEKMFMFIPALLLEERPKKYDKFLSRIEKYEQITDNIEVEIATYLTRISEDEMTYDSSKKVRAMLKIIDDMESVGDVVYQLSKIIDTANQRKLVFTKKQTNSISEMFELVREAFVEMNKNLVGSYQEADPKIAYQIEKSINKKRNMMRDIHVDDLKEKKYKHKVGTYYSDVFSLTEKVGDYIINVTEAIVEYQESK